MQDIVQNIADADSMADLWRIVRKFYRSEGFGAVAYSVPRQPGLSQSYEMDNVQGGFPENIADAYAQIGQGEANPVPRLAIEQGVPMRWTEIWAQIDPDPEQLHFLTELRHRGLVRTNNAPIGDLAEHCAAIVYDGLLAPNSEKSYDLVAVDGRTVQVKVRVRRADTSSSATFSVIRSFDFDVCLFLLIDGDGDGDVVAAREWTVQEVRDAGRHKVHINGSVVRLRQVTSGSALGVDRLAEFRQAWRELAAQTR